MKYVPIVFLGLVALLQLTACIVLPLPPLGAQVGLEDIEKLELDVSTRTQAHDALGDPDVAITDRYEIFDVSEESFNLLFVALGVAGGVALDPTNARFYRVLAEYRPDGVLHDLRWESYDEVLSTEPVPRLTWPDTLGLVFGAVSASRSGRLLAVSDSSTNSIALHDGQSRNLIAKVRAIAGCRPLGIRPRDWPWLLLSRIRGLGRMAFPAATVFLGDDEHLASIAEGDTICIWNANSQTHVREFSGERGIWGMIASRSAPIVAAIDAKGVIGIWDGSSGSKISSFAVCERICADLRMTLSDDGQILATVQYNYGPGFLGLDKVKGSIVRLWDARTGKELAAFAVKGHSYTMNIPRTEIAVSPDLRHVALIRGRHAEVWRISRISDPARQEDTPARTAGWSVQLEQVMILPPFPWDFPGSYGLTATPYVAFSADGRKLAAGYASAVVWEVGTWREIWRAPSAYSEKERAFRHGFVFTGDGRHIITNCCSWEVPELDESRHVADLHGP